MQFPSSFVTFVVAVEMLMLSVISSYSQGVEYNTHSRKITLSKSTTDRIIKKNGFNRSEYFWAAFSKKPDPDQRKILLQNGIKIQKLMLKKGNDYIYKIKVDKKLKNMNEIIEKNQIIIGIEEIVPVDKISKEIIDPEKFSEINTYDSTKSTIVAYVKWHDKVEEKEGTALLKSYGINEILNFDSVSNKFIVKSTRASLISIAEKEEISEVNELTIESPVIINDGCDGKKMV